MKKIIKKTVERTWSEKEYQRMIGLATNAVKALLALKQKEAEPTPKIVELELLTNCALDDIIRVIWRLTKSEKTYGTFKRDFLEALEEKMKNELES